MDEVQTYYTIEILITNRLGIPGSSWVEYRGEGVSYDWWNYSPIRFKSEDEAVHAIGKSALLKVKITNTAIGGSQKLQSYTK